MQSREKLHNFRRSNFRVLAAKRVSKPDQSYEAVVPMSTNSKPNQTASFAVMSGEDSAFLMHQHFEQFSRICEERLAWKSADGVDSLYGNDRSSYQAAMWEGWPSLVSV